MTATGLKFMVDVGVGKKVEQWLRETGCSGVRLVLPTKPLELAYR